NIEYIIRDQSPHGEVYSYLEEAHPEFFKKAKIVKGENIMHSGGHNEMIRHMKGEYYICASFDMLYPSDFVSKIIEEMQKNDAKVATCRLMKWDFKKVLAGDLEASKTRTLDSLGIALTKSHQFVDTHESEDERDVSHLPKIIGPSGALGVYHKDALKEVAYKNKEGKLEYFDELMHYKNDCDLAYRFSWSGFPCLVVDTKVYHDRQLGKRSEKGKWEIENSLKGHLIAVQKNFDPDFSWGVRLATFLKLKLRFLYILLLHPRSLKVYGEVRKLKSEINRRKKAIRKNISPKDLESIML
ncbi:MAG: glycosyltransferase, partial [Candidatus Peregrinibacteria bacterium]|nr:glycosyltransferase [Candidatus Peregrinibacteria bacterium]